MKCIICETGMRHLTQDLFICDICGLISSDIKADPSIYDKSYLIKYQRYARSWIGDKIHALRYGLVSKHVSAGKLLDFGCGNGGFLKECAKNGIVATGFDINPYGIYSDLSAIFSDYTAVTFWDSIEHLPDPKKIIMGLCAEYIFICTPCVDDFFSNIRLPEWRHYYPGEHVHYFSENSLKTLLEQCGYKIIETNYDESEYRKSGGAKNILTMGGKQN